ncbi:MAG TPA: sugar phosphate isomerase/epimerase [Abditibacteriaceae bacterium]|jgi:sugar phosphate isomerase/epimerase
MEWLVSAFADEAGDTCDVQIAALQRAGLKHIDIRSIDGFNITALLLDKAREIKQKLDDAGISVNMFGSPIGKIDISEDFEIDLAKLRHLGELAPVLGCNAVRIFSYFNKEGASHEEWKAQSLKRLEQLRSTGQELGLVLYHENERHIFGDLANDVEAISALRNDSFKLIFDFDNYNQSGENVWDNWLQLREATDSIHLKDSKDGQHTPAGQGGGFVREILTDAVARGWNGPVSVEPHLSHSGAVAATGPSGIANAAYGKMPAPESFHIACTVATDLLGELGVQVR